VQECPYAAALARLERRVAQLALIPCRQIRQRDLLLLLGETADYLHTEPLPPATRADFEALYDWLAAAERIDRPGLSSSIDWP
jgi:hypothetical protein